MPNITLVVSPSELEPKLEACAKKGEAILELPRESEAELSAIKKAFFDWDDYNKALLDSAFDASGWMTVTPSNDYNSMAIKIMDLAMDKGSAGIPAERLGDLVEVLRAKIETLRSIARRLDVYQTNQTSGAEPKSAATEGDSIFIVHGHALHKREELRRFLGQVTDRRVVVLEDQSSQGHDVLGKLLEAARRAAYAVVLLTGDDDGRVSGSGDWKPRARQNVVLELGLFLGLLGRDKVAAIHEPGVEIPSDFAGVVYIKLDEGSWKMKLATELRDAGIAIDLNQAI
ncbi:TIR domain-containing protein [Actinokineospora pegani]|uniref:TIR domain-containing protein n=1 Tax=Actinokineospora pegani TaxID=2654637 RepID=UPI0012EA5701|nr:TIR domain-containing protein [Actinokineospora pegani]